MKQKLLLIIIIVFAVCNSFIASAQSINVVPNPSTPGIFAWTGSGALSGYAGNADTLNNTLVLEYNASGTSDTASSGFKLQLAVYNAGNNTIQLIPNPDAGHGVYFNSVQIVFNNKLFIIYLDAANVQRLASFDGTSVTLYPNPDAGLGYIGSPRIYNNNLYVAYSNAAGVTQFARFNGSGLTLIPNPDNSSKGFFNDYAVIFDGKICSRYITVAGPKQLATYDGISWTLIPNPDNTSRGFYPDFPVEYHNKLYILYYSAADQYQYMVWDGVSNPTLIANPENSSTNNGGVTGLPILYNDTLFFQYYNTSNVYQLAKLGGSSISLVPNPDNTTFGYSNIPVMYNNNLYIFYITPDGLHHLTQYQTASNSLKVYANPDGGFGYWDKPIVYGNNLYFMYYNAQSAFQLGYFDGNSIKLINNPGGIYNGAAGNNGYTSSPIIFNNLLYMQFGSVPYGNAGNLATFDGSVLPITLLSFNAILKNNAALLNWSTSSEFNNKGFEIQKSINGQSFAGIGFVNSSGNSFFTNKYNFTDAQIANGTNYYRLKQIDFDGKFTYSKIVKIDFSKKLVVTIRPNPVHNYININTSSVIKEVRLISLNAKLINRWDNVTSSSKLDISGIASGVYILKMITQDEVQSQKIVKE